MIRPRRGGVSGGSATFFLIQKRDPCLCSGGQERKREKRRGRRRRERERGEGEKEGEGEGERRREGEGEGEGEGADGDDDDDDGESDLRRILAATDAWLRKAYSLVADRSRERKMTHQRA